MPYLRLTLDAYSMMDLKARCICVEASGNQLLGFRGSPKHVYLPRICSGQQFQG